MEVPPWCPALFRSAEGSSFFRPTLFDKAVQANHNSCRFRCHKSDVVSRPKPFHFGHPSSAHLIDQVGPMYNVASRLCQSLLDLSLIRWALPSGTPERLTVVSLHASDLTVQI